MKKILFIAVAVAAGFSVTRCAGSNSDTVAAVVPTGAGYTYSTTSNVGDYAEWTFTGSTLTATWKQISSVGAVEKTFNINADCLTFNSTYGYLSCTINSGLSSCSPGTLACGSAPSGNFDMMEVPGVAMFVHTNDGTDQLHVGMLKDSSGCAADVSGDYVFAKTGVGQKELFGLYRSDANFLNVTHADFKMVAGAQTTTPVVTYSTSDASGAGTITLVDGGCSGGVRSRTTGPTTIRSMMTTSGLFVLDLPSGQGGIVSFKTANAASLADFAGKNFGGISFPDNGSPQPLSITSAALSGSTVPLSTVLVNGSNLTGVDIRPATNTTSAMASPAYPDMTAAPTTGSFAYSANALQATFANPAAMPGMFRIDSGLGDSGRVMLIAAKLNSKVVAFGFVYNWRTSGQTNPSTGAPYSPDGLYNTGNFILFER